MKIRLKRKGEQFSFEAKSEEGHLVHMDASPEIGGENTGMRPMQVLLSSLAGCSAIDVLLILKKQKQNIVTFEIDVEGTREKAGDHSLFRNIILHFKLTGQVEKEKADRAVALSLEKYCSVAKTLEPTASITYTVSITHT